MITGVNGPIDPAALGRVDAHEHVFLRSPVLAEEHFDDPVRMAEEIREVAATGISTIVDLTPIGLGRKPRALAELAASAGVNVVLATGVHRKAHYRPEHWLYTIGEDELTQVIRTDLEEGIDDRDWQGPAPVPTSVRAGIVKLGASYHAIRPEEHRWFRAGAAAAVTAGAPVAVHTEIGTAGHDVLDTLESMGVAPEQVMLAHLDRNPDANLHAEFAARGTYLGYDTIGRTKYHPDSAILDLIEAVHDRGHGDRILLGTDVGRSSMLTSYGGGPGMAVLGRTFLPRLIKELGADVEETLMIDNPRRFLTGPHQR